MSRLQNTQYVLEGLPELMELDTGLRKSQRRVLKTYLEADMDKKQTGVFNLATGFGKTRMMSILALAYKRANPDGKVLIVVPSTSLIKDENGDGVVKKFHVYNKKDLKSGNNLDFGTYYGKGIKSTETEFTVTTYSSLAKYAQKINPKEIGLLLLDEAHHALSETRSETIRQFSNAAQYGMTATPGYDSEKNLVNLLENQIAEVTIEEAIKEGDLADTKNIILVSGTPVDLTKVPKVRGSSGDYDPKEYMKAIARAMNGNSIDSGNEDNWKDVHRRISEQIAEFYRDYEDDEAGKIFGKKCMINCRSQEEARITALSINKIFGKMMAATYVSGNKGTENETVLKNFISGNLPILCQVGKLSEGFDFRDLDIVFNFPTHSRVREAQLGGRAIRKPSNDKRKKTALVIDIAFAHPDVKNVIKAIHKNGQVLFQDIMGEPYIKEKGHGPGPGPKIGKPTIRLKDFYIISDKKTLFYLSQEAKKLEEEEYVPPKRDGMWSSFDLTKKYKKSFITMAQWLEEAFKNKEVFYKETDKKHEHPLPLVQYVQPQKGRPCYCLHEAPEAIKRFEELHPELQNSQLLPKRDGMLSSFDLAKKYKKGVITMAQWLKEAFKNKEVFYKETDKKHEHPLPLVQYVQPKNGHTCYCLHEAPEAIKRFEELHPELLEAKSKQSIPPIRPGMKKMRDLVKKFRVAPEKISKYLKEAFERKEVFYKESDKKHEHPLPLVEYVKSGSKTFYCLHEAPEAIKRFEELHPELLKAQQNSQLSPKRDGMWSSNDLMKKYKTGNIKLAQWLEEVFKNKEVFYKKSDKNHKHPLPLVEYVKSGPNATYCLHEAPEALEFFKNWVKKTYGVELKERTTSPTLRPRLKAGSTQGNPKAPPVRKPATPEL